MRDVNFFHIILPRIICCYSLKSLLFRFVFDMDSKKIRMLLAAVQAGSMMQIAEENGYTPSGLTHMMSALEQELGLKLINRSNQGVSLTANGQKLLPYLQEFLRDEDRIIAEVSKIKAQDDTMIRIGAYPSIAKQWLPPVLRTFQNAYPTAGFNLVSVIRPKAYEALLKGDLDFAFCGEEKEYESQVLFTHLKNDDYYVIFPPEMDDQFLGKPFPIEELKRHPFIMPAFNADTAVSEMLRAHNIELKSMAVAADYQVIISMVAAGLGLSIMPELIMRGSSGNYHSALIEPHAWRDLGIISRKITDLSRLKLTFLNYIKKQKF